MGELINLRRARKTRQRQLREGEAAAKRIAHGTPKRLKKSGASEKERAQRAIEAHKLDPDGES